MRDSLPQEPPHSDAEPPGVFASPVEQTMHKSST